MALCILCSSRPSRVSYRCGTRIEKYFPKSENNSVAGWFSGTIVNHQYNEVTQDLFHSIHYDDNDKEVLSDSELRYDLQLDNPCVKITSLASATAVTSLNPPNKKARIVKAEQVASGDSAVTSASPDSVESKPGTVVPDNSAVASVSPDSVESKPGIVVPGLAGASVSPDSVQSNSGIIVADNSSTPMSASAIKEEVLTSYHEDKKCKKEKSASFLAPAERQRREACFKEWQKANRDPVTKLGRFVFRRGCHAQCITKILGGSGIHPWPKVNNPPMLPDFQEGNPYIKPGEFYVAGNEGWNPYGPRFPGDSGFVNVLAFKENPDQKEFHLFVQCSSKPHKRHWHGKSASLGRMYVGVYRRIKDDDEITSFVSFAKDMDSESQAQIASCYVRWHYEDFDGSLSPNASEQKYREEGKRLSGGDQVWNSLSPEKMDMWTMVAFLIDKNYKQEVAAVQFVRFDENLYKHLVRYGCAVTRGGERGRVSLEAEALHQYY